MANLKAILLDMLILPVLSTCDQVNPQVIGGCGYRSKIDQLKAGIITFHPAVDYSCKDSKVSDNGRGTSVFAAHDGIISELRSNDGTHGNCLTIGSRIFTSVYAHLDSMTVKQGDAVKKGQKIGTLGATGSCSSPHLHFELSVCGLVVDPLKLGLGRNTAPKFNYLNAGSSDDLFALAGQRNGQVATNNPNLPPESSTSLVLHRQHSKLCASSQAIKHGYKQSLSDRKLAYSWITDYVTNAHANQDADPNLNTQHKVDPSLVHAEIDALDLPPQASELFREGFRTLSRHMFLFMIGTAQRETRFWKRQTDAEKQAKAPREVGRLTAVNNFFGIRYLPDQVRRHLALPDSYVLGYDEKPDRKFQQFDNAAQCIKAWLYIQRNSVNYMYLGLGFVAGLTQAAGYGSSTSIASHAVEYCRTGRLRKLAAAVDPNFNLVHNLLMSQRVISGNVYSVHHQEGPFTHKLTQKEWELRSLFAYCQSYDSPKSPGRPSKHGMVITYKKQAYYLASFLFSTYVLLPVTDVDLIVDKLPVGGDINTFNSILNKRLAQSQIIYERSIFITFSPDGSDTGLIQSSITKRGFSIDKLVYPAQPESSSRPGALNNPLVVMNPASFEDGQPAFLHLLRSLNAGQLKALFSPLNVDPTGYQRVNPITPDPTPTPDPDPSNNANYSKKKANNGKTKTLINPSSAREFDMSSLVDIFDLIYQKKGYGRTPAQDAFEGDSDLYPEFNSFFKLAFGPTYNPGVFASEEAIRTLREAEHADQARKRELLAKAISIEGDEIRRELLTRLETQKLTNPVSGSVGISLEQRKAALQRLNFLNQHLK